MFADVRDCQLLMPPPKPIRKHDADPRRALRVLADCGDGGCTEAVMLAHGFTIGLLAGLIRDGLVTVEAQRIRAPGERSRSRACGLPRRDDGHWGSRHEPTRREAKSASNFRTAAHRLGPLLR